MIVSFRLVILLKTQMAERAHRLVRGGSSSVIVEAPHTPKIWQQTINTSTTDTHTISVLAHATTYSLSYMPRQRRRAPPVKRRLLRPYQVCTFSKEYTDHNQQPLLAIRLAMGFPSSRTAGCNYGHHFGHLCQQAASDWPISRRYRLRRLES